MARRALPLLLALAVVATACGASGSMGGTAPPDDAATPVSPAAGTGGGGDAGALNAVSAPLLPTDPFALPDIDLAGYRELLSQLEGTPVLVNIWASWCGPCREEAPDLAKASEQYGDRVQFLGLDILDDRDSARAFMREFGWRYPSVYDPQGAVRDGLGYIGQPITVIYDARGDISFEWNGAVNAEMLETELERVL